MKYELPPEPEGPVWDSEGRRHERNRNGLCVVVPLRDAESVASATPLVALPPEHVGDSAGAVKWLVSSKSLQPAATFEPKWTVSNAAD